MTSRRNALIGLGTLLFASCGTAPIEEPAGQLPSVESTAHSSPATTQTLRVIHSAPAFVASPGPLKVDFLLLCAPAVERPCDVTGSLHYRVGQVEVKHSFDAPSGVLSDIFNVEGEGQVEYWLSAVADTGAEVRWPSTGTVVVPAIQQPNTIEINANELSVLDADSILFEATWGSGEGSIGKDSGTEYGDGPPGFIRNSDGTYFVLDPLNLRVVAITATGHKKIIDYSLAVDNPTLPTTSFAVSPTGDYIYIARLDGLFVIDRNGNQVAQRSVDEMGWDFGTPTEMFATEEGVWTREADSYHLAAGPTLEGVAQETAVAPAYGTRERPIAVDTRLASTEGLRVSVSDSTRPQTWRVNSIPSIAAVYAAREVSDGDVVVVVAFESPQGEISSVSTSMGAFRLGPDEVKWAHLLPRGDGSNFLQNGPVASIGDDGSIAFMYGDSDHARLSFWSATTLGGQP